MWKHLFITDILSISRWNALRCMPQDADDDNKDVDENSKSALV